MTLTRRQADCLTLASHGHSNTAIAHTLRCTEKAVERALEQVYEDMGINGDDSWNPRVRAVICWMGANQ